MSSIKELSNISVDELKEFLLNQVRVLNGLHSKNKVFVNTVKVISDVYFDNFQYTRNKVFDLVEKYGNGKIKDYLSDTDRELIPHLSLYYSYSYQTVMAAIDVDGDIYNSDEEIGSLIRENTDLILDEAEYGDEGSELDYFSILHQYELDVIYTIIVKCWLEAKGYSQDIIVKIGSNAKYFYVNDMRWDHRSFFEAEDVLEYWEEKIVRSILLNEFWTKLKSE